MVWIREKYYSISKLKKTVKKYYSVRVYRNKKLSEVIKVDSWEQALIVAREIRKVFKQAKLTTKTHRATPTVYRYYMN